MIELFKEITSCANIKALVSSRLESVFANNLNAVPQLKMETLTNQDWSAM